MGKISSILIKTDYITLGQFIKFIGLIKKGSEIKNFLKINKIYVNNELEKRRGKKLYPNTKLSINGQEFLITK